MGLGRVFRPVVHRGPHRLCSSTRKSRAASRRANVPMTRIYAWRARWDFERRCSMPRSLSRLRYDRSLLKRTRIVYRSQSGQRTRRTRGGAEGDPSLRGRALWCRWRRGGHGRPAPAGFGSRLGPQASVYHARSWQKVARKEQVRKRGCLRFAQTTGTSPSS